MNRFTKFQSICVLSVLISASSTLYAYTLASWPEEQTPILSPAEVDVRAVYLNNWLADNIQSIQQDQVQPIKENIYLVIDSIIKQNELGSNKDFTQSDTLFLKSMFNWASYLGVPGSDLVSGHFTGKATPVSPRQVALPKPFSLTFKFPLLRLSSSDGNWALIYPYWFKTGNVQNFQAHDGLNTEIAEVSTAFARHIGIEGYSQATILFIFSPGNNGNVFRNFWMQSVGIKDSDISKDVLRQVSATYIAYDATNHLYKELTFLHGTKGDIAVVYTGIDGTYQANRKSYIEFMNEMKI